MSTLTVTNIKATGETASRAVSGVAAAWADFDQTVPTLNNSLNVSSATDTSSGLYTVNYSSSFNSTSYAMTGATRGYHLIEDTATNSKGTSFIELRNWYVSGTAGQRTNIDLLSYSAMFGDLA
jgi:hypothetical protein